MVSQALSLNFFFILVFGEAIQGLPPKQILYKLNTLETEALLGSGRDFPSIGDDRRRAEAVGFLTEWRVRRTRRRS